MGLQKHFKTFHDNIKLGREDDDYKKARERDTSITKDVKKSFKDAGYPVIDDFLLGSHGTSTAVQPLSGDMDIDRALVIDEISAPDNPVNPKNRTLGVLEDRGFKNAKIKKPCVTADYTGDNVHIDFPIFKKSGDQYYLAVGKKNSDENNREWSISDPIGLKDWIKDKSSYGALADEKQTQYRRIVRYSKRWRDNKFSDTVAEKIFSIALTVMAKECFIPDIDNDLGALRQTVQRMLNNGYFHCTDVIEDKYKVEVTLPVQPYRDIFTDSSIDTGTQFRNKLKRMLKKLEDAEAIDDVQKQCKIMNELFGDDFPVPESTKESALRTATLAPAVATPKISFGNSERKPIKPKGFA